MSNPKVIAKAKAIDATIDKIFYAGAALLAGLVAAVIFSSNAKALTEILNEKSYQTEIRLPFELKSQKLSY
ncbi:MAG: hypothetical protein H7336_13275 [Bacteriovorax sp.]|nr:hypothetical protein [Bacteriovorax sp.]